MASNLQIAFERELEAIVHDAAFSQLEIVQHRARHERGATAFRVTIDRPGGADLALCERVAARLNDNLESLNLPYTLEVESAGLERPLLRPTDYRRFAGSRAKVVTSLTIGGAKTHRGTLRGINGEAVILDTDSGELPIPLAAIKSANLEFDPRLDLQRDKRERKAHGNSRHGN